MQRIERYGVLALVFLLVTIVTFALWDDGSKEASDEVAAAAPQDRAPGDEARNEAQGAAQEAARRRQVALAEERRREAEAVQRRLAEQRRRAGERGNDLADLYASASELGEHSKDTRGGTLEEMPTPKVDGSRSGTPDLRIAQREARDAAETAGAGASPDAARRSGARRGRARGDRDVSPVQAKDELLRSKKYEIAPGDTLGAIAAEHLGSASKWKRIAAANPDVDPNRLIVGETITIPARSATAPNPSTASAPEPEPSAPAGDGERYTVRPGDLLSVIAQERLGSVSEMPRILALNPGLDPDRLQAGQVIRLPEGAASARPSAVASAPRPASSASSSSSRSGDRPRVR